MGGRRCSRGRASRPRGVKCRRAESPGRAEHLAGRSCGRRVDHRSRRVEVSENTGVLWIGAAAGGTPLRVAPPGSRREGPQLARGHQPRVRRANASSERISQSTIPRLLWSRAVWSGFVAPWPTRRHRRGARRRSRQAVDRPRNAGRWVAAIYEHILINGRYLIDPDHVANGRSRPPASIASPTYH